MRLKILVSLCIVTSVAAQELLITEFMAKNDSAFTNQTGNFYDWIEIHNPGISNIDLTGWFLTDEKSSLQKWEFPATNINAGAYMLVFASDLNKRTPGEELHTNFKLSSSGELLALIKPDGITVSHAYYPAFPEQFADISYGLNPASHSEVTLLGSFAPCKAVVPENEGMSSNWIQRIYDDNSWVAGNTGVGYDTEPNYFPLIGLDLSNSMFNVNASCYIRIPFYVGTVSAYDSLILKMKYDDGFIAYLNGVNIAATNSPGNPTWNSTAVSSHSDSQSINFVDFNPPVSMPGLIENSTNILAIHGLNQSTNSSDALFLPELVSLSPTGYDTSNQMYFDVSSPGEANNEDDWAFVKDTKFSVDRGFYNSAFDVAITTATENATIRYTLDGSRPTETHGAVYSTPITINGTTVLRAFGYKSGFESSDVDAQTYIFIDDVVNQPNDPDGWPVTFQYQENDYRGTDVVTVVANWGMRSDLMAGYEAEFRAALTNGLTISLSTDMNVLFDLDTGLFGQPMPDVPMDHPLSVEIFDAVGGETIQLNAAARMMGNATGYPDKTKSNLRLLFKSEFVDPTSGETFTGPGKLNFPFFEDTEVETFNTVALRAMLQGGVFGYHGTCMKDAYVHRRLQDMGHPNVHCRFVHVYINGLYFGLFQATERPDDSHMAEYFGGAREDYDIKKTVGSQVDIGTVYAWNALKNLVPTPTATLSPADYQTLKDDYIDIERYADYMLLMMFIANSDWPGKNFYWNCRRGDPAYGPPDLKWIPFTWDSDFSMGENRLTNDYFVPFTASYVIKGPIGRIWNSVYDNTDWRRFFGDRAHKLMFNGGELSAERLNSRWLNQRAELAEVITAELCKWSKNYYTPADWSVVVASETTTFISPRHAICLSQLRSHGLYPNTDTPVYSQHGGVVPKNYSLTMTNPNGSGTVWYTIDDSDPRDSGTAIEYTGSPVTITGTTRVKACVDSGSEWSAMNEAVFQVVPALIVSEIMYNPIGTGPYADQEYEFIELHNTGTSTVDMSPVQLTKGVDFSFAGSAVTSLPANAYVVVVRNPVAFASLYNTIGMLIAGMYSNSLNNAGEQITLSEKYEQVVTSFIYDDAWYPETDGAGYSLVHLDSNPATDPNSSNYWEVSKVYLGSPGRDDSILPAKEIVINELLAHTDPPLQDAVEICNLSSNDIAIGNWFLSDSSSNLKKYEIPGGTIVPATGYVVFYEYQFNSGTNGFGFSSKGEEVHLASSEVPPAYYVSETFGASENGVSFGRYVTPSGVVHFVAMSNLTFGTDVKASDPPSRSNDFITGTGAANSKPKIGPIIINEFMYNSPGTPDEEYIELYNFSGVNIPLYNSISNSNPWVIKDDTDLAYSFVSGDVILAGGLVVVVGEGVDPASFRFKYRIPDEVPVLGPCLRNLSNGGDAVKLFKPEKTEITNVPYILVEQVEYEDVPLWPPEADGDGKSLQRISAPGFANDPYNWKPGGTPGWIVPEPGVIWIIGLLELWIIVKRQASNV